MVVWLVVCPANLLHIPAVGYVLQAFYLKKLGMCLQIACFSHF